MCVVGRSCLEGHALSMELGSKIACSTDERVTLQSVFRGEMSSADAGCWFGIEYASDL